MGERPGDVERREDSNRAARCRIDDDEVRRRVLRHQLRCTPQRLTRRDHQDGRRGRRSCRLLLEFAYAGCSGEVKVGDDAPEALSLTGVVLDDDRVHAVFIRAPWVERVGPDVQVLGQVGGHIVAVRQGRMLATAFHPEMTGDRRIHKLFVDML